MSQFMSFSITQFYLNPKYRFDFSYKIQVDLCATIERQILRKSKRIAETDWSYWIIITSERKSKIPKLSEQEVGKRNRQKTMSLTLPYDRVRNSKEPVVEFCQIVFECLENIVSSDYEIDEKTLIKAKDELLKKVQANPKKYYEDNDL